MNKSVFITGASSGIGRATALLFAEKGWNVIATMRDVSNADALLQRKNIFIQRLDVEDAVSINAAVANAIKTIGTIDVLVNNAGFAQYGIFESVSEAQMRRQFEVNVFGVMNVTRAVLPHFRRQRSGTIINVTSGTGKFTVPLMSLYSATKFAVEGFSESLSYELASQNIKVRIIEPGSTATHFHHTLEASTAENKELPDYSSYLEGFGNLMAGIREKYAVEASQPEDIAKTIFEAATDESDTLRYVSGNDIRPFVELRTSSSEEEYITFMRKQFAIK